MWKRLTRSWGVLLAGILLTSMEEIRQIHIRVIVVPKSPLDGASLEPLHFCFAFAGPLTLSPKEVHHQPISKDQLE